MKRFLIPFIALLFGVNSVLPAQTVVSASIDSLAMLIGQQSKLSIQATQPADRTLQFPVFSDKVVDGLDLVSTPAPDTVRLENGSLQVTHSYIVTAFDSALVFMPGFEVIDGEDTILTNPLSIKIVDMPVDTTQQAITDIKGVYEPPFNWVGFLTIVGYVIIGLAVVFLVWFFLRRYLRNKKVTDGEQEVEPVDPRTAHQIAFDELEALRNEKLWQNNRFKEYYTQLTEIVRRYIYRRYAIGAMEQTSDELLSEFRQNKDFKDMKDEVRMLAEILQVADLVKFAKFVPLPPDCERSINQAEQFVDRTKQVEEIKPDEKSEVSEPEK